MSLERSFAGAVFAINKTEPPLRSRWTIETRTKPILGIQPSLTQPRLHSRSASYFAVKSMSPKQSLIDSDLARTQTALSLLADQTFEIRDKTAHELRKVEVGFCLSNYW